MVHTMTRIRQGGRTQLNQWETTDSHQGSRTKERAPLRRSISANPMNKVGAKSKASLKIATFEEKAKKRRSCSLGPDDRLMVEKLQDLPPADPPAAWSKSHAQGAQFTLHT